MKYTISNHAREEMVRRAIPLDLVDSVLRSPEQTVPTLGDVVCCQSRVSIGGVPFLLRVMVNASKNPPNVVTVYRTSKITKYWRPA